MLSPIKRRSHKKVKPEKIFFLLRLFLQAVTAPTRKLFYAKNQMKSKIPAITA